MTTPGRGGPGVLRAPLLIARITAGSRAHWLLVALFFFGLTIVETWPLVLHLDDRILGWAPDSYQVMWNIWWFKEQVLSLDNPFRSDLLWYPQGTDLYMHTLTPVNGLAALPAQIVTGNVLLSWNVVMLAFFTLSGVGGYALAYHVSRNPWAALLGGIIFAFSPFVMVHIHGHLNIATTWPIPFFVLSVLKFADTGARRYAIFAGVLWATMTWNWLEFALDSGLFLVLFGVFWGFVYVRRRDREQIGRLVRGGVVCGAVWLALSLPILIPSIYEVVIDDVAMSGGLSAPAEFLSADLLGYVTPSELRGSGERPLGQAPDSPTINSVEGTVFLGFLPLILASVAIIAHWRTERRNTVLFWAGVFAFFAIMALGPFVYFDNDKTFDLLGWEFSISAPFRLFKEIPLVGLRRVPARMIVYGYLALAVLAPLGLTVLAERIKRVSPVAAGATVAIALTIILAEYWNPPVGTAQYNLPPFYERVADEDGDFALLELPVGRITGTVQRGDILGGGMTNYAQITHGKRTIGGYISRGQEDDVLWLRAQPGIGYLSCPGCPDFPRFADLDRPLVLGVFRDLGIKYIIVNLESFEGEDTAYVYNDEIDEVTAYIDETLQFPVTERGEAYVVYRNPDVE